MSCDHYGVLGVGPDATAKDITKAFRAKARQLHPDKQPPGASEAAKLRAKKAFQELVNSYEVLNDANKRARYNLERSDADNEPERPAPPPPPRTPPPSRANTDGQHHRQGREREQQEYAREGPEDRRPWWENYKEQHEQDAAYAQAEAKRHREKAKRRQQEEENSREARQKWRQKEQDKLYAGLGSHWVRPPTSKLYTPPADTKIYYADDDSDASSVLSFDPWSYLDDFDMKDIVLEPDEEEVEDHAEVWTIRRPSSEKGQSKVDFDAVRSPSSGTLKSEGATGKAVGGKASPGCPQQEKRSRTPATNATAGTAKPCCALQ